MIKVWLLVSNYHTDLHLIQSTGEQSFYNETFISDGSYGKIIQFTGLRNLTLSLYFFYFTLLLRSLLENSLDFRKSLAAYNVIESKH